MAAPIDIFLAGDSHGRCHVAEKGQVVIPAEIRARYALTPGTQVEFVDKIGVIRLVVRRRVAPTDPAAGYGLIKAQPAKDGAERRLSEFDAASLVRRIPSTK